MALSAGRAAATSHADGTCTHTHTQCVRHVVWEAPTRRRQSARCGCQILDAEGGTKGRGVCEVCTRQTCEGRLVWLTETRGREGGGGGGLGTRLPPCPHHRGRVMAGYASSAQLRDAVQFSGVPLTSLLSSSAARTKRLHDTGSLAHTSRACVCHAARLLRHRAKLRDACGACWASQTGRSRRRKKRERRSERAGGARTRG